MNTCLHSGKIVQRFLSKIAIAPGPMETPCWLWKAHVGSHGYGQMWDGHRTRYAHILGYEIHVGAVQSGLELDHLCRTRHCVNHAHVEPVTRRINLLRGETIAARKAAQTHCQNGHPLSGKNLIVKRNGARACRICSSNLYKQWVSNNRDRRRELDRQHYARKKEQQATAALAGTETQE